MEHVATLPQTSEKQSGLLSRLFNYVVAPVREYIEEIKEAIERSNKTDEMQKNSEIEHFLKSAFFDKEITSGKHLQKSISNIVKDAEKQGELYYGITANDVLAKYAVLSDEKQTLLKSANKFNDWDSFQSEWSQKDHEESVIEWINSPKFEADKKRQIDHLLNWRMGTDLNTMTETEKIDYINYELESSGMSENFITVQDVLNRYEQTGQTTQQSTLDA